MRFQGTHLSPQVLDHQQKQADSEKLYPKFSELEPNGDRQWAILQMIHHDGKHLFKTTKFFKSKGQLKFTVITSCDTRAFHKKS